MRNLHQKSYEMTVKYFNIIPGEGSATLLLYGDIGDGYKVESGRIVSELISLQSQYEKIDVRINSRGGDVFSGMAIYNALRQSKSDITIYIDGVAASIAAIIALCGKPLYMSPYARLMLHSVSGGTYGNASALRQTADQMEQLQKDLANMIAGRCGMKAKDVQAKYFDEKDHWIDAQEAVAMKLCDGIYDMATTEEQPKTAEEIYNFFNNRLVFEPQKNSQEMALIDDIKAIPSFSDKEDASAIVAHIKALENKATKVDALQQANDAYKTQIANLQAKEVDAFLNAAVSDGKITKEQLPTMKKLMISDRAAAEELINSMKVQVVARAVDFIDQGGAKNAFEGKTWDQLDKENRLADLKAQNKKLFCSLYKDKFGVEYKE